MKNKKILFVILLLHITAWVLLKPVWPFSDDYCYSSNAYNFLEGHRSLTYNQFQNRFGIYLPVSTIFYFFGISPYTIALWPLLASCLTIAIVFLFLDKTVNTIIASVSALLIALNILQITYSIALFPDLIVSFYFIAVALLLYQGRQQNQKLIYPVLFNLFLLIGFLTKESILFIFPFLLLVFCFDLYKKQNFLFWKRAVIFGLCSVGLLLLMYYSLTGDAFFRIKAIQYFDSNFLNEETTTGIKATHSSNILGWFQNELGYIFILIFSIPAFFALKNKSINDFRVYILMYTIVLLAEYIFLFYTEKYTALFMLNRMWMPFIAPLSILTAFSIQQSENEAYDVLLVVFGYLVFFASSQRAFLILLFLVITCTVYLLKRRNENWKLLLLLPFLVLSGYFVYCNSNYRAGTLPAPQWQKVMDDEGLLKERNNLKI